MKTYMPLNGLRWSRNSGSANCDMPQSAVFGRPGGGLTEAMSTVISSLGNVGPGLGAFGPAFSWAALPDAAKWVLSFLMLIGRLELFAVLLLFYSGFWER